MIGSKKAVLISEAGWRGLKELSSVLLKNGLSVDIIIKGGVDKEVLDVITKPGGLKIRSVRKIFFAPYLFFYLAWHKIIRDIKTVIVSKEETGSWIKNFGLNAQLLVETESGYILK